MAFTLTTPAFEEGASIPDIHSCKGDDTSPLLRWGDPPKGTETFALIMEDPDAPGGTFTHWMIYNIPKDILQLDKVVPIQKNLDSGAVQAKNDFGKVGYGGPCPPKGEEHRYFFKIYALKNKIPKESIQSADDFYNAVKDSTLEKAEYMGKFRI
jgi:hypothetical protein